MIDNTVICTSEQLAKTLLISKRHVRRLANEGILSKAAAGEYRLLESIQGYIRNLNEQIPNKQANDAGVVAAKIDIAIEQAKLVKHKAELARLEEEEKKGILINVEDERRETFKLARIVRNTVMGVPSRISQNLAVETDANVISRVLEDELRDTLTEIADLAESGDELLRTNKLPLDEEEECYHWHWIEKMET